MFRRNLNLSTEKKKSTDAFIAMLSTREHFQLSDFSVNFPTLKQTVIFLFINEIIGKYYGMSWKLNMRWLSKPKTLVFDYVETTV